MDVDKLQAVWFFCDCTNSLRRHKLRRAALWTVFDERGENPDQNAGNYC